MRPPPDDVLDDVQRHYYFDITKYCCDGVLAVFPLQLVPRTKESVRRSRLRCRVALGGRYGRLPAGTEAWRACILGSDTKKGSSLLSRKGNRTQFLKHKPHRSEWIYDWIIHQDLCSTDS